MAIIQHPFDGHHRDGFRLAIVVVILAFVALLASALTTAGQAQEFGDARAGQAYAQKVCAECHAVLGSEAASPVARATPFKTVANTPGMTGTAIAVWLRTPHPTMPNLIVARDDLENLVSYILDLREKK
jgi:mono/diheme cytochrome c family protein